MSENITQAALNKVRKDKFLLVLSLPNIMKGLNSRKSREDELLSLDSLQFSLYDIIIPQHSIPEVPIHFGQQNYNVTSYNRPAYPPVRVGFEVDNEFKNYWVLWKWQQLINDPIESTYAGKEIFPNGAPESIPPIVPNYQTTITVFGRDEYDNKIIEFTYKYAFITKLGELSYNYREHDQLGCSFEFVFNQMDIHLL